MAGVFHSARLLYRAVEDDDEGFILSVESDPTISGNSNVELLKPASKRSVKGFMHFMQETALLGVIICLLPSAAPSPDTTNRAHRSHRKAGSVPIGYISLGHELGPANTHHRAASVAICISAAYQGQGYGTEAINWILDWGFQIAGLHRVAITSFSFNEGAGRLYERMGFTLEGRRRESLWFEGRFHDMLSFSMLRDEWEARSPT